MIDIGCFVPPLDVVKAQPVLAQIISLPSSAPDSQTSLVYELEAFLEPPSDTESPHTDEPSLRDRVGNLEDEVAELEADQVSPSITLSGEAIFGVSAVAGNDTNEATVFQRSIELIFSASFTGEELLEIGIEGGES